MGIRTSVDKWLFIVAPAILLIASATPLSAHGRECVNVRGDAVGHATGPDSFESVLTGGLQATVLGTNFQIIAIDEDGTLHGVVNHEFITTRGRFFTFADVVFSPIAPNVYRTSERNVFLSGGTGIYEDVSGRLAIQVVFDFTTGQASSGRYHGRICTGTAPDVESDVITIDYPGASSTVALDINRTGDIVGRYVSATDGRTHGFLRTKQGAFSTIDFPGAVFSVAAGTNIRGDIVGMYRLATDGVRVRHGFLLRDGVFTTIDPPGAAFTNALGINAEGHVVGRFCTTGATPCTPDGGNVHGFLLADGQFTTIDVPGALRTNAWKIDPRGTVVGGYTSANGTNRVFVLAGGRFSTVALPPTIGIALENGGIGRNGNIAGTYCDTAPCTGTSTDFHGFVLTRRDFRSVDVRGAVSTAVFAINARGDVVGFYDDATGQRHGFVQPGLPGRHHH